MKKITFDTGVEAYKLPGGVLRFNPTDPNVYARFRQAAESLQQLEQDMAQDLGGESADLLQILERADKAIKQNLRLVFGPDNDFDALVGGVNLLSVTADGKTVAEQLFAALEPVLVDGAKRCAQAQAAAMSR